MTFRPLVLAIAVLALASCAIYTATPPGRVKVQALTIDAPRPWNKWAQNQISDTTEIWTSEGLDLDFLGLTGGLADGQTIFKARPNTEPPRFRKDFDFVQVAELFEYSLTNLTSSPVINVSDLQPATFAGRPGFRFSYAFTPRDELVRSGIASGAVVDGKLYLIFFHGSRVYHFDKYREEVERIMASAIITP